MHAEWDAANPGLWEVACAAADRASYLREECDRRWTHRKSEARIASVMEGAPRILALVQAGLKDTAATDAVTEWARTKSWCLLLLGGVGCGKSTAAAKHALDFARANPNRTLPLWARAVESSRMSAFGDSAEDRFASWRVTPLLVMDDLGTELMTATWQQALDDVLDWRYQHSLPTILPSNLSPEEFKKRYGDRISDRIREDGTVRQLDSKSMRRRL
jgi:DNA replication protein DnaC